MGSDVLLAIGHHIAAFTVLATLAAEWALVRPGLSRRDAIQVRVIDAVYGIAAGTVLVIGLMRVFLGPAHASFYLSNPFFWAKISAFAIIGLLSIAGTTRYQRALFPLIPVCAALMARGIGA
jgi:putative membrane protein